MEHLMGFQSSFFPKKSAQQLASVAQLVRALHRNARAVGSSIPTRGPYAAFFAAVPGQILKCIYTHLDY